MTALTLIFRFTPADGSAARDITVTIETQENERKPFILTIDWADGRRVDRYNWPGPPLFGLEQAGRFVAQSILDHVESWGGGTVEPEVDKPLPYLHNEQTSKT